LLGGNNDKSDLKSGKCYDPSIDTWAPVVEMSVCFSGVDIGILDGILYSIDGSGRQKYL